MIINTNINALIASGAYKTASNAYTQASTRISTQLQVNSAKDDPVGLGIANKWAAKIASYAKAVDNINDGISAVNVADVALEEIQTLLSAMKTLATSSASSTNSATLASNQTLFASYMTDIDSIANNAYYNGTSLLNGDTPTLTVQSGINAGDTTTLTFGSVLSSALGTGDALALTSLGASTTALASGDLVINGKTVGTSLASYDSASYLFASGSAIAKAAAINLVSGDTNVVATVGTTNVGGTTMTSLAAATGSITINGTAIAVTLSGTDYATNRAAVVTAINNNSSQTGVTAVDNFSTALGVSLTASDGRNITVSYTTLTAANTGVAAQGTYAGTYSLRSLNQSNIVITSNGTLANADLALGTYSANVAQVASKNLGVSTAAPTAITAGDMSINGYAIGASFSSDDTASDATATSSTKVASGIALAAAINRQTTLTGVTATVNPNVVVGTGFVAGTATNIYLNGKTIAGGSFTSIAGVVSLLNTYTGQTGVTASNNGSGVTLTAADGRNISIATTEGVGATIGISGITATTAAAAATYRSTVTLTSDSTFTIAAGTNGNTSLQTIGFREGTYGGTTGDYKVSDLNISTATGGSNALTTLADAIDMVSAYQAIVGAQINRMGYQSDYVSNLSTNASTAYGNIMDYDLAAETTALAVAQTKQNGALAMLAQANISQDMVAYLLKQYIS
ncbi:flagellin [Burkholderiaceae bacterium]